LSLASELWFQLSSFCFEFLFDADTWWIDLNLTYVVAAYGVWYDVLVP